jgi:two-component system phosphate regulon sensor histidine kinase PhoR
MGEGAVTLTKEGVILFCNPRFAEMVQSPYEQVVGSTLKRYIAPNDNLKLDYFLAQRTHGKQDVLVVSLTNTLYLRLSIHHLPPYLHGDNYLLIATDIRDLKKKENELNEMIGTLVNFIQALRALRIDNINETIDVGVKKMRLELVNDKLQKEINKLNRLLIKFKQKQKESAPVKSTGVSS